MLFGANYDSSLWLIINTDKKNREELVEFIKNIPTELYTIIREKIAKHEWYVKNKVKFSDRDEKHLSGEFKAVNGLLYRYAISSSTGALELLANATYNGVENIIFFITLLPCEDYKQLQFLDTEYIGDFSYYAYPSYDGGMGVTKCDSVRYRLIKVPFGHIVYYSSDNSFIKDKYKGIDLRRMPSEIDLQDLESAKSVNRLVRSRRKK